MAVGYMGLGTLEQLREQIIQVALDRAFLQAPLPTDEMQVAQRLQEGQARLSLIGQGIARLCAQVLAVY